MKQIHADIFHLTKRVKSNCFVVVVVIHICAPAGGLSKISSDPVKAMNEAVDESTNVISSIFKFAASLIAPEDEEGSIHNTITVFAGV